MQQWSFVLLAAQSRDLLADTPTVVQLLLLAIDGVCVGAVARATAIVLC